MKLEEFEEKISKEEPLLQQQFVNTKFNAWILAMRLRTLPLALSGILLGASFALLANEFSALICFLSLICGLLIQILSNLANDYGDADKGLDGEDRVGPKRMVSSGYISAKEMLFAIKINICLIVIFVFFLLICSFGTNLTSWLIFSFLALACVVAALKYTMGKNPYGYRARGDFYVFIFFGPVTILGSYYLYGSELFYAPFFPAVAVGLLSTAVLNINNIRDMKSDEKHGKITMALQLGDVSARQYHLVLVFGGLLLWLGYLGMMFGFMSLFLLFFALPIMISAYKVYTSYSHAVLDKQLKITSIGIGFFHIILSFAMPLL